MDWDRVVKLPLEDLLKERCPYCKNGLRLCYGDRTGSMNGSCDNDDGCNSVNMDGLQFRPPWAAPRSNTFVNTADGERVVESIE